MFTKFMTNYQEVEALSDFQAIAGASYVSHQPLSQIMPSRLGGVARHYIRAEKVNQIVEAAKIAINNKIPYRVIGAGTATLVGESGFPGLIIQNVTSNIFVLENDSKVCCDSGVENGSFISALASRGRGGVEFLSVIPGTVGSALATNAGSFGRKISSYIRQITLFDPDSKNVISLGQKEIANPEFLKMFRSDLVFPPIILSLTVQLAALTQEEIIRRLGLVKKYLPKTIDKIFSHLLSESVGNISSDKEFSSIMKQAGVSYNQQQGALTIKKDATPTSVRKAIDTIVEKAHQLGIEEDERLTYLGYFNEGDVA